MAVIRVNKTKDYTVMSNIHFRDKSISLKAKGLLSLMLSLPEEWNYTIAGLVVICKENESAIKSALTELKEARYLTVTKKMPNETESGRIEYIYDIFEKPIEQQKAEKQGLENLCLESQGVENQGQYNTNKSIIKKLNTNELSIIYNENFEMLWKMLKPTQYDRKSQVKPKRKKELYEMGDKVKKAIEVYLKVQDGKYYHSRNNFLNDIIDNYIDKSVQDFQASMSQGKNKQRNTRYGDFDVDEAFKQALKRSYKKGELKNDTERYDT